MSAATQKPELVNRLAELFNHPQDAVRPDAEKDHAGRFKNGNRGGPGNPFARRVAKLRQAMIEECAEEDLRGITRSMIDLAKQGDKAAAKLVYQYTLGKPAKMVDPDRIDEDELNVMKGMALPQEMFASMMSALPADAVNRLLQGIWPGMVLGFVEQVKKTIAEQAELEKQMEEDDAEYEALPAEEKLKWYAAGQLTPPPELVEQAAQEKAAREASGRREPAGKKPEGVPTSSTREPSPNGVSRGDKFMNLSEMAAKSENVAAGPSTNGVSGADASQSGQFEQVNKLVPTKAGMPAK